RRASLFKGIWPGGTWLDRSVRSSTRRSEIHLKPLNARRFHRPTGGTAWAVTRILQIVVDRESQFEIVEDLTAAAMQHDRPGTISPDNIGDMRSEDQATIGPPDEQLLV